MAILPARMRTRRQHGLWLALLASSALHALFLAWLAIRPPAPTPPTARPPEPPVAIQLIELPPAPGPSAPPSRPGHPGRRAARPARSGSLPSSSAAPAASPASPGTGELASGPASGDAPRVTSLMPSERALEGVVALGGKGGPVVLDGSGEDGIPVPSSERHGWAGPGSGIHAPRVPRDLVGEAVAEALGKRRAELGIVDPYFQEVARALEEGWQADRLDPPPQTLAEAVNDFGKALRRFKDVWMEGAERFGVTGNPLAAGAGQAFDHGVLASGSDQIKAAVGLQTLMSAGFTSVRKAVLRVVQDEDGRIVLVELVEPSSDRDMDVQALADVRAAAERLPPPPASLLGSKTQLSSFWTFEIRLRVIPPSAGIAFEFDEKGVVPLVPFGHQVRKSVRLLYFN